jgi:hypothetical protein
VGPELVNTTPFREDLSDDLTHVTNGRATRVIAHGSRDYVPGTKYENPCQRAETPSVQNQLPRCSEFLQQPFLFRTVPDMESARFASWLITGIPMLA